MDPFRTLRFSHRKNSLLITFVAVELYVTLKVGKHSIMRVFQELISVLACRVEGASRIVIQFHFASSKHHFLHPLAASTTITNLNPVMI